VQRFRQRWVWLLVLGAAAGGWWMLLQQVLLGRPVGDNPALDWVVWLLWALIGVGLPLLFLRLKMVLEVKPGLVVIHYRPVTSRVIPCAAIERLEIRTYSPIKEYGGWGIRGWSRKNMAYNVSGNRGVQLTLRDGRRVMLGSPRPEALARAIEAERRDKDRRFR
jgi:hypothetical protein